MGDVSRDVPLLLDLSNKVVYIRSDAIYRYPNVIARVRAISMDCGRGNRGICGPYPSTSHRKCYVVLYFSSLPVISLDDMLKNHTDKIVGYLVAVVFDDMNEIYDVCVASEARKHGAGKGLIKSIISNASRPKMWLGIDINNPIWSAVVKLYISNGFLNPTPGNTTPHGITVGITFIGLTWNKDYVPDKIEIERTIRTATRYRDISLRAYCRNKMSITRDLLLKMKRELVDGKNKESSGLFRILCYDEKKVGTLGLQISSLTKGELTVSIPTGSYYVTFHTHPDFCYVSYGCYIGWPSGTDMALVFKLYVERGILVNLVISKEGVYVVTLTPMFQLIAQLLRDTESGSSSSKPSPSKPSSSKLKCSDYIYEAIKHRFGESEVFGEFLRKEKIDSYEAKLQKYYSDVSAYTLSHLIKEVKEKNEEEGNRLMGCISQLKLKGDPILFTPSFFDWKRISINPILEMSVDIAPDSEKLATECPLKLDFAGHGEYEGGEKCNQHFMV